MYYSGQRALIVGASGAIGLAIAEELFTNGCEIAVTYLGHPRPVEKLAARAKEMNRRCLCFQLDLRDRSQVVEVCAEVIAQLGVPTILVNSAGIIKDTPFQHMHIEDWSTVIETNLFGPFFMLREMIPLMIRHGGGRIVNLASVSGLFGLPGQVNYAASKGAIIAMTRALARELGPFNITVNAIAPGVVETEMTCALTPEIKRRYLGRIPLRRFAAPEDIVPAARLLMSKEGAYITGQVLIVDGGLTS